MQEDINAYCTDAHHLYCAAIKDYIASKQTLLVVLEKHTGDFPGWLLNEMQYLSDGMNIVPPIAADHTLTPTMIIKSISRLLPKKINRHARFMHQLREILTKLSRYNKSALFIVDHAQHLSYTTLAVLAHLADLQEQRDQRPIRLRIVLCGRPSLLEKCQRLQIKQFQSLSLFRWNKERMMQEVLSLLAAQRLTLNVDKQQAFLETIYRKTAGIPELVDRVALSLAEQVTVDNQVTLTTSDHHQPVASVPRRTLPKLQQWWRGGKWVAIATSMVLVMIWGHAHYGGFLAHMSASRYTLQLTTSGDSHTLQDLVSNYHLQHDAMIIKDTEPYHSNYVLRYGHYSTKAQAIAAIRRLPQDIRALNPQVKKES